MERWFHFLLLLVPLCSSKETPEVEDKNVGEIMRQLVFGWNNDSYGVQLESQYGSVVGKNVQFHTIRVYKGRKFVTTFRHSLTSIPVSLFELQHDDMVLRPFPSSESHDKGSCENLQFVSAVEIDPTSGWMWIVDNGWYDTEDRTNSCPAKLIIYDLNNDTEIQRHVFKKMVTGYGRFLLNNIVLDFVDGKATFAYITDVQDWKLIVYDHQIDLSYNFLHPSMDPETGFVNVTVRNFTASVEQQGVNGIAISPDFKYVYFSALAGVRLYRIPTSVLRDFRHDSIRFNDKLEYVGDKMSLGDSLYMSNKYHLFYSLLDYSDGIVARWNIDSDESNVTAVYHDVIVNKPKFRWIASLTIDENKQLWFIGRYTQSSPLSSSSSIGIFSMDIGERSYMDFTKDDVISECSAQRYSIVSSLFVLFVYYLIS